MNIKLKIYLYFINLNIKHFFKSYPGMVMSQDGHFVKNESYNNIINPPIHNHL